ncbi:DUF445 domain-containing protein [Staphylococcus hyicus]|uniref:DUF445 domain-containing protein n=1 Tax=Staphylococcus hyicus TaxID=1284 RepID=UPI00373505A0
MKLLLIVICMTIIGAIIGGVTNMIAIKMLFHPFRPYYFLGKRLPFTPGLIPKRREEIATKIGGVVEEHLLTEALIREKLESQTMHETIKETVKQYINRLHDDDITLQRLLHPFNIQIVNQGERWVADVLNEQLERKYLEHSSHRIRDILPDDMMDVIDRKVFHLDTILLQKGREYLSSDKGYRDIYEMLNTFFNEKSRILSVLLMFMSKDDLVNRVQAELLCLLEHPKAQSIIKKQIIAEYETMKQSTLSTYIHKEQFDSYCNQFVTAFVHQLNVSKRAHQPLRTLAPNLLHYLSNEGTLKITDFIIQSLAQRLTQILRKINISGMVEEQINRFDLDYIERLILEIANKELKLIMLLGFILGGIIGFFQGLIAIFV